jgi:hypothetical protein
VTRLSDPEKSAAFLGLFHKPGETFFIAWRPIGQREGMDHQRFNDPVAAARAVLALRDKTDVYFTPANFRDDAQSGGDPDVARRLSGNMTDACALWADVDCGEGKPYASIDEALQAIEAFGKALLPPNLIVGSGGGAHVYWDLDECLPAARWQLAATALKTAFVALGLHADPQCTADASRLLRPPLTINWKGGHKRRTSVLYVGEARIRADALVSALLPYVRATPVTPAERQTVDFKIKGGMDPLKFCKQLALTVSTHGRGETYPQWFCALQYASCHEGQQRDDMAIVLSDGHEGFDCAATLAKVRGIHAPPLCVAYNEVRPGICHTCPAWGHIASPASLWRWERVSNRPQDVKDVTRRAARLLDACRARGYSDQLKLGFLVLEIDKLRAADPSLARNCAFKFMKLATACGATDVSVLTQVGIDAGAEPTPAQRFAVKMARIATTK